MRGGLDVARVRQVVAADARTVAVGSAVIGLLLGPRVPASVVLAVVLVVAAASAAAGARPVAGVGLAAVVLAGAVWGDGRAAGLDATALVPGERVRGDVVLLAAPRASAGGGRRALARLRGEPVLLRIPPWQHLDGDPGTIVTVTGELRAPDLAAAAFRAHATLRADTVRATGRRRGGAAGVVDGIRRRAERALAGDLPPAQAGLLRGMVLGQDDALPDDLRDAFRASGLAHLVAASGANVALLAGLALAVGAVLGVGIRLRWCAVLVLIALYVPLAGGGASIQRAGVMGALTLVAALAGRPSVRWHALVLAAAATLAFDPRAAGDAGWQLSFAAVLGILLLAPRIAERVRAAGAPRGVAEAVALTASATIATAPIIALTFDRTSLVSLPANVLATPAVAPVMWLGMLAAAAGQVSTAAAGPFVELAAAPLAFLTWLARTAAETPAAEVAAPAVLVALACAAAAWAAVRPPAVGAEGDDGARARPAGGGAGGARGAGLARVGGSSGGRRRGATAVVLGCVVALLLAGRDRGLAAPVPGVLRVAALDVGQGDATLLQAGGHALLVDAGPPDAPVVARLRKLGVRRLDAVLATHGSSDHVGGVPAVLGALPVGAVLDGRDGDRSPVPGAIDPAARAAGVPVAAVREGHQVRLGPMTLRVLWPPPTPTLPGEDPNLRAVVAIVEAHGARVLLTADAESPVLGRLALPSAHVLKVPHHGSADPGLPGVLEAVRPRVAMIEVGERNTYGHPAPSTLAALRAVPEVLRTDEDGTAVVELRGDDVRVLAGP